VSQALLWDVEIAHCPFIEKFSAELWPQFSNPVPNESESPCSRIIKNFKAAAAGHEARSGGILTRM
jgi:hypothetical protein